MSDRRQQQRRADDNLEHMRTDGDETPNYDWPDRLLHDLAEIRLVDEKELTGVTRLERQPLSKHELAVLHAVSLGMTTSMVARTYGVADDTVKTQLKSARAKLHAKNTCHACCEALRQGLIK